MPHHCFLPAKVRLLLLTLFLFILVPPLQAEVKLAGVFGNNMVLQRDTNFSVWGNADPGESVTVSVAGQSASTKADADGNWCVTLHPLHSCAAPIEFIVTGTNTITLQNVLIGDVWLCSGQSNMVYPVYKEQNTREELPQADHPTLRLCGFSAKPMREPLTDRKLQWSICTPATAKTFSAVGYFFGRTLLTNLAVPIGLISSAVSGTPAQSWTSLNGLKSDPALKPYLDAYEQMKDEPAKGKDPHEAAPGTPASLFNGMIAPLTPLPIKGVVWYQGESNTDTNNLYQNLLPALVRDWRRHWGQKQLPFLIVQLPGFGRRQPDPAPSKWAAVREAQALAASQLHTGLAVTLDLSAPRNILHPPNKREVGRRLALVAEEMIYGEKIASSGPVYKSSNFKGAQARITFDHVGSALDIGTPSPTDPNEPSAALDLRLKGFTIAGTNQIFVRAEAVIDGNSVIVSSPEIAVPVAVRYGWEDNPEVTLYNRDGLPAAPFRTDTWPFHYPAPKPTDKNELNEAPKF